LRSELAQLTGLSETTFRFYVQQRLIRPNERRGTATRYARRELLRLLALSRLRFEGKTTLEQKKQKLDSMGDSKVEARLRTGPVPQAVAKALGFETVQRSNQSSTASQTAAGDLRKSGVERWQRITLLPGLELMLSADAKVPAQLAAQRIIDEYVVSPPRVT